MAVNFELYKVFYYVAEYGNITHAANELCLTQPGVTKAIQNLESQMGCRLFIRTRRGVKLTADGALLFQQIQPACKVFLSAEEEMSNQRFTQRGIVRVSSNNMAMKMAISPAVGKFREMYPNVTLSLSRTPPADIANALASGIIDISIEFNAAMELENSDAAIDMDIINVSAFRRSEINTQIIGTYRDIPLAGPEFSFLADKELTMPEILEYPIIIPKRDTVSRNYYNHLFKKYNFSKGADIEASGPDIRVMLAKQNIGICFMPLECVKNEIDNGLLIPLTTKEPLLERKLLLMTSNNRPLSYAAKALIQMIV